MDAIKKILNIIGPNYAKDPTTENAFVDIMTSSLVDKDTSFAIIGIRCCDTDSTGRRKLTPGIIYPLISGYCINDDCICVNSSIKIQSTLYDDFFNEDIKGIPHVQISAIVGQNGSGKSSIIEFLMRLINNFAAATIGEIRNSGNASEHLHFIDMLNGEFWYVLENNAYHLRIKNCSVRLYKYSKRQEREDGEIKYYAERLIFDNDKNEDCKLLKASHPSVGDEELKKLYENFFYTLISNQAIYAYNTKDFYKECNFNEKEIAISGTKTGQTFSTEELCWLHGLFHKNDAYKTPLVLTPYRYEGNIDINSEHDLAIERLVRLFVLHENLRTINDHLLVHKLNYAYVPGFVYNNLESIRKTLHYELLTIEGYEKLKSEIVRIWGVLIGKDLTAFSAKAYYEEAISYLVYKTLKISYQYKEHRMFYDGTCMMTDAFSTELLEEYVKELSLDLSHITRKLYQTIAYIVFDVYELTDLKDADGNKLTQTSSYLFEELATRWWTSTDISKEEMMSSLLFHLRMQAMVPPPFMQMRIKVCEINNKESHFDFETLSSGEKQQIFTVSSLLYHLDNLDSAHKDESTPHRVCYNNVCIVLEEIELYYHPQLQQQFIHYFLNGLKQISLDHIKSIHLIVVTHSPYVLSDIPRTNVLALKKNESVPVANLLTFGANVHDMLKDSFFLEGGSLGMFAQWEISHLVACMEIHRWAKNNLEDTRNCPLKNEGEAYSFMARYQYVNPDNNKEYLFSYEQFCRDLSASTIKNRILMIDEPVIYRVLMDEYYRTFPEEIENLIELKKQDLQRQLKELEK